MDDRAGRLASLSYDIALADDIDQLRTVVTYGLRTVIDADLASYSEVSQSAGTMLGMLDFPVADMETLGPRLFELSGQHPLIVRHAPTAEAISDHLSDAAYRSLELYQDVYRQIDAVDQLAVTIHQDTDVLVGLALNRSRRGFSAEDRRTLEAVAGVTRAARTRVIARGEARLLLDSLEQDGSGLPTGVIALSRSGTIDFISDRARGWLTEYFPAHRGTGLPAAIRDPLLAGTVEDSKTIVVEGLEGTLTIRRLAARAGDPLLLQLGERIRPSEHRALTHRERQVLERVGLGESNAEIADALHISKRTVENHLRAIYRKLAVNSRTAALARARA